MMTKTGMWLTYIASCSSVFVLQIISKFFYSYTSLISDEPTEIKTKIITCWNQDRWLYVSLII